MQWKIAFADMQKYAFEVGTDVAVSTMNALGSLACMASGASFAIASSSEDALSIAYFGASDTDGTFNFYLQFNESSVQLSKSIPFKHYLEMDGMDSLNEYLKPKTINFFGMIMGTAGTFLRAVARNIQVWKTGRDELALFNTEYLGSIQPPTRREYKDATMASILASLSSICFSNAIVGSFIQFSGGLGTNYKITYPAKGDLSANSTKYKGPLKLTVVPLEFGPNPSFFINRTETNNSIKFDEVLNFNATANVTYGGGVFFNTKKAARYPLALPMFGGISLFMASGFFAKKAEKARIERILQAKGEYDLMI